MNTFFVIVNKTTKKPELFPDTSGLVTESQILQWIDDMVNNNGMGSDQELVASNEPYARPQVDERLMKVDETKDYSSDNHPIYSNIKQWLITYKTSHRDVTEKKIAIDDAEYAASETTIPTNKRLKYTILALDSILKHIGYDRSTSPLNEKNKNIIKEFKQIADKVRANDTARESKHAQLNVDPNSNPDLNADWTIDNYSGTL